MTRPRSTKPTARKAALKATTKRSSAKTTAAKTGGGVVRKKAKIGSLSGASRISSSARAELNGLLVSIHRNIDEAEALLAE